MKTISSEQAAQIDRDLVSCGYSIPQLMELAGYACSRAIHDEYPLCVSVLVICGPGNNGGDGIVASRHLAIFVSVVF
jgi:NAD(P)H-hydrate epimerase